MLSARRSYSMAPCVESVFGERPKSKTVEILTSIRVPKRMKKLQINSAVMIPLCVKDGKPSLLFTRRAFTLEKVSISLPILDETNCYYPQIRNLRREIP